MKKIGLLLFAALVFSGCMSEKERMIKEGYPVQYAQGYEDGCNTGRGMAGGYGSMTKKIRLYDSDKDYFRGWNEGKEMCFVREKSNQDANLKRAIEQKLYEKKKK